MQTRHDSKQAEKEYLARTGASDAPGQTAALTFTCPSPPGVGRYCLKFDLVAEGATWFEATGSQPVVIALQVD